MPKSTHLVFGRHSVMVALRQTPERVLWVEIKQGSQDEPVRQLESLAKEMGVSVTRVSKTTLDKRSDGGTHQGVVAGVRRSPLLDESALETLLGESASPLFLVLDRIQDPHNLGACLRSADGAGVTAVIVPRKHACDLTPVVRKVACGAAETVPFVQVTNLARCLDSLKAHNVWCVGLCGDASASFFDLELVGPVALVLGAEGPGLRRLTRERCDVLAKLPMVGLVESLNVSVASGICLFEAVRQRASQ